MNRPCVKETLVIETSSAVHFGLRYDFICKSLRLEREQSVKYRLSFTPLCMFTSFSTSLFRVLIFMLLNSPKGILALWDILWMQIRITKRQNKRVILSHLMFTCSWNTKRLNDLHPHWTDRLRIIWLQRGTNYSIKGHTSRVTADLCKPRLSDDWSAMDYQLRDNYAGKSRMHGSCGYKHGLFLSAGMILKYFQHCFTCFPLAAPCYDCKLLVTCNPFKYERYCTMAHPVIECPSPNPHQHFGKHTWGFSRRLSVDHICFSLCHIS